MDHKAAVIQATDCSEPDPYTGSNDCEDPTAGPQPDEVRSIGRYSKEKAMEEGKRKDSELGTALDVATPGSIPDEGVLSLQDLDAVAGGLKRSGGDDDLDDLEVER